MNTPMDLPLISIVMPAYNSGRFLAESIETVLAQSYSNWELLIVDNASRDNSRQIAQSYADQDPRIKLLTKHQNDGVAPARRYAIDQAQSDWIAFLDSDDLWTPDKLEIQMNTALKTGSRLLFTGSSFIDSESNPRNYIMHVPAEVDYHRILKQNVISLSSVLVRRELLEGCFHEPDNTIRDDFSAWIRILRNRERVAVGIDQPLLRYRVSENSLSSNKLHAAWCALKTYRYAGLSIPEVLYYWCQYLVRGLLKYSRLFK